MIKNIMRALPPVDFHDKLYINVICLRILSNPHLASFVMPFETFVVNLKFNHKGLKVRHKGSLRKSYLSFLWSKEISGYCLFQFIPAEQTNFTFGFFPVNALFSV